MTFRPTSPAPARTRRFASLLLSLATLGAQGQWESKTETTYSWGGWSNSGPAVFALSNYVSTNFMVLRRREPPSNANPALVARLKTLPAVEQRPVSTREGAHGYFAHFAPESLSHLLWTNFLAHTNRQTPLFAFQDRTARPPRFAWNTNSWVWGRRGLTACSPMSEAETWPGNAPGQIAITAVTRRHGYTRGHSMGGETGRAMIGVKVWFVTAGNEVIARTITGQQTRTSETSQRDYTVVLFDADLPVSLPPVRVAGSNYLTRYPWVPGTPHPMVIIEQSKTAQAGASPFSENTWKGGDSGGPIFLPLPRELVFVGGIGCSPPSEAMQADLDALSRKAGLKPEDYRMEFIELSDWPAYAPQR